MIQQSQVFNIFIETKLFNLGVSIKDLSLIIDYMYSGKIQLSDSSVISSLKALGCHSIVPLLSHFKDDVNKNVIIEDADHANCFLIALERFYLESKFFDCILKFQVYLILNLFLKYYFF